MIRTALLILAVVLIVLSVPAIVRTDALRRAGRSYRRELLRFVLAIAAGGGLILVLARTR